ncbi:hypothetical protein B14911_14102 [Bacillus sp. NRRL B-14911]|nr:hypothetical protein B14911_14102 [Bacillus sp. NRRL B-14911]OXT17809.1 hypothetical protein B9K06_07980 [Bacillus sp. OG2]
MRIAAARGNIMKIFLIISQLIYVICLIPWFPIWGLSFMSFDSGIALGNSAFVIGIGLYPVAVIVCSILGWVLRGRNKRLAIIFNSVPMIWIIGFGLLMIII